MKFRLAGALWLCLCCALAGADSQQADYAALRPHKALAVAPDDPAVRGIAEGELSDIAASTAAAAQCSARRPAQAQPCEINRLDERTISTGAQIRARVPAKPHPLFLWRYDSVTARVYLAGSIHVMKPSLLPLPPQFDAAFAASDRLAVEVDADSLPPDAIRAAYRTHAVLGPGESLATVLRPATLAMVEHYLASQAMTLDAVAALKPAMLATQLAVTRLNALGYLPQYGIERYFLDRAGAREVLALEKFDQQLAVLTSPPLAVQDELLAETLAQMDTVEPVIAAMIVAWFSGNDREFRRLFDQQTGTSPALVEFERRLLDDRNVGMAAAIERYLEMPGTTFVLVGAAHLTGERGIVALLGERGARGRRIQSNEAL